MVKNSKLKEILFLLLLLLSSFILIISYFDFSNDKLFLNII